MKILSVVLCFTVVTGCANLTPKENVRLSGSGTQYEIWKEDVLEQCAELSAKLAIQVVEEEQLKGSPLSKEQSFMVNKYFMEKCIVSGKIVI